MKHLAIALLLACGAVQADDDHRRVPLDAAYVQECGSCHVAYPPGLLPATSWQRLMEGLPRHFGADASLEPAAAAPIAAWLQRHAGTGRRAAEPPQDRITQGAWFKREHREVAAATWALPAVKSASQCQACHTQAEAGSYREREIRLPR